MSIRRGHANIDREHSPPTEPSDNQHWDDLEPLFHRTGSLATDRHQSRPVALVEGHRL